MTLRAHEPSITLASDEEDLLVVDVLLLDDKLNTGPDTVDT